MISVTRKQLRLLCQTLTVSLCSLCLLPSSALAGGTQSGTINWVSVRSDGVIMMDMNGTVSGRPSCANVSGDMWLIKDENSVAGKMMYAMLLSAYHGNKTITVYGTGACTRWNGGEDIDSVS